MTFFKRKKQWRSVSSQFDHDIQQRAISLLVARHPNDYMMIARAAVREIPNGGSIIPWRYKRQIQNALDESEYLLIAQFTSEWLEICQMLQHGNDLALASPDDFKQ